MVAGRFPYVAKCIKIPLHIRKTIHAEHYMEKVKTLQTQTEEEAEYKHAAMAPIYDRYEGNGKGQRNDVDSNLAASVHAFLEQQRTPIRKL